MADREVLLKLGIDFTDGTKTQQMLRSVGDEASKQADRVSQLKKAFGGLSATGQAGPGGERLKWLTEEAHVQAGIALEERKRLFAVEGIEAGLRGQQQTLLSLREQLNPALLGERVRLTIEEIEARKKVAAAFDQERVAQGGLTQLQEQVTAALASEGKSRQFNLELEKERAKLYGSEQEMRRADAQDKIGQSLKSQRQTLADIKAALDPAVLQERVKLTIEEEKLRKKLNEELAKETKKQGGGKGVLAGLASSMGGITGGILTGAAKGAEEGWPGAAAGGWKAFKTELLGATLGLVAFKSVALASPGAVERFTLVLEDTAAVIGQTLTPVLEVVTQVVKLFGDILATLLPSADEMRDLLKPIVEFLADLREALAPLISVIHDVLIVALKALGVVLNVVLYPFKILAKMIAALFGSEDKKLKDSTGAAARTISFQGQEQYAKSVYAAAYKTGGMGESKPEKDVPGWLEDILNVLRQIGEWVRGLFEFWVGKENKKGEGTGSINPLKSLSRIGKNLEGIGENKEMMRKAEAEAPERLRKTQKDLGEKLDRDEGKTKPEDLVWMIDALKEALKGIGKGEKEAQAEAEGWIAKRNDKRINRAMDGFGGNF